MYDTGLTSTVANPGSRRRAVLMVLLSLVVAGCQSMAPLPEPRIEPMDEPLARELPRPETRPTPPRVLLVLAEEQASLRAVFDEISGGLPAAESEAVSLSGATVLPEHILEGLGRGQYRAAVAVGHGAATALTGKALDTRIFCQVFDDRALRADGMAGVALLPSPEHSLAEWKRLSPEVRVIGMITGPGKEALVADATAAAQELDIELIHREVDSDQAYYQTFRAISRRIDGLMLIPDHRVLSPAMIRNLFAYAQKRSVQVLAFTPSLLELGAVAVSLSDPGDVAARVLSLLNDSKLYAQTRGGVLPLTLARIETGISAGLPTAAAIGRHAQLD